MVESIEVIRGGQSGTLHGNAMGRRGNQNQYQTPKCRAFWFMEASAGSFDTFNARVRILNGYKKGNWTNDFGFPRLKQMDIVLTEI